MSAEHLDRQRAAIGGAVSGAGEMGTCHWTEMSWRIKGDPNPLWGHVGEDPNGRLLLPSWSRTKAAHKGCEGWWDRPLNLRRPTHWLPYLRSRRSRMLAWLEEC